MRRLYRIIVLFLIGSVLSDNPVYAYGHKVHDDYMIDVLFGENYNKNKQSADIKKKITALEYASYLCIDQFNHEGKKKLEELSHFGVSGIPRTIDSIDFTDNNDHRQHTHKGWNYEYPEYQDTGTDKANWTVRKTILQSTVKKIFDKGKGGFFKSIINRVRALFVREESNKQYDSLCVLVYYVHILGDQIEADEYSEKFTVVPLVEINGHGETSIIQELETAFKILFASQTTDEEYMELIQGMETIRIEAEGYRDSIAGLNDQETFERYRKCHTELMDLLVKKVPELLKNEAFFNNIFY